MLAEILYVKTVYNPLELVSESEKQICKHQQQYKQLKAEYETLKLEQSTFAVTSSANIVKVKTNKKRQSICKSNKNSYSIH